MKQVGFSATNNLRSHLRRHSLVVAPTPSGRLTQHEVDTILAWYVGLFQGHEDDDNDEHEADEEEGDNEEDENEEDGADEVQEDEEVEDDQ